MLCRLLLTLVACHLAVAMPNQGPRIPPDEKNPNFWRQKASDEIRDRIHSYKINNKIAKNVILFIGDGMGPTTVTAARILRGQLNNQPGEETVLAFDDFPHVALSKTYNVDRQTPDSAGTATAILSGVKTNYFLIGLDARAQSGDCPGSAGKHLTTMLDWANAAGMKTGVVTTARITHATPAASYAHSADRYWEGDVDLKNIPGNCKDIARQLVEDNNFINVVLGGGRRFFLPNTTVDPEYGTINSKQRQDGRNLITEWEDDKRDRGVNFKYVWNKDGFDSADPRYTDYLLGLFEPNHMQYELDRNKSGDKGEPSLAEMTRKAIQMLKKDDSGYFLLVEGARIDHGHHDNKAKKALHDALAMEDAVRSALELVDTDDTLVIVTADHSSPFDITGYQWRGTDIFGLVSPIDPTEDTTDGKPYSVLHYGNGPGYSEPRVNLTVEMLHDKEFLYPTGVPMPWATHGGEDVSIFAKGPMSHLFYGVHEQNYIGHVMAYAACIGEYMGKCTRGDMEEVDPSSAVTVAGSALLWLACFITRFVLWAQN